MSTPKNFKDLTGQKFGRLNVYKRGKNYRLGQARWWCWCDCEIDLPMEERKKKLVMGNNLTSGQVQSCGCLQKEKTSKVKTKDLTGKTFGYLKVIKRVGTHKGNATWECECICEKHIIVPSNLLSYGLTKSCGCKSEEMRIETLRKNQKRNSYKKEGTYYIGYTINTNHEFLIDSEDYEKIKNIRWFEKDNGYIFGNKSIYLHRLIMNPDKNMDVDHINGKVYDNRKQNLRIVTRSQNLMNASLRSNNTSGVRGVSFVTNYGKWVSYIDKNKEHYILGYFDNFEDAVKTRKEAEEKYFGEYSYYNSRGENKNNELFV